jgi:hypothetical protein
MKFSIRLSGGAVKDSGSTKRRPQFNLNRNHRLVLPLMLLGRRDSYSVPLSTPGFTPLFVKRVPA